LPLCGELGPQDAHERRPADSERGGDEHEQDETDHDEHWSTNAREGGGRSGADAGPAPTRLRRRRRRRRRGRRRLIFLLGVLAGRLGALLLCQPFVGLGTVGRGRGLLLMLTFGAERRVACDVTRSLLSPPEKLVEESHFV